MCTQPVPVSTSKCSSSTSDVEEGTSGSREGNAAVALLLSSHLRNVTMQSTNKTGVLTAAGKLSHAAGDTAAGTNLECERGARITD